jgi:vacuolar protein sorting-associated protein 13A/C
MLPFNMATMAVGNITDAPIKFNALIAENMTVTPGLLLDMIQSHYVHALLSQMYKIILSVDVFFNPVKVFGSVSSGVRDIFYEPLQGLVSDHPQDFGAGLVKGAASLVKNTVFGFSDGINKFAGSVGKGLSLATMDNKYQEQRRIARSRNKPRHAVLGVTAGAQTFVKSVFSGVSGIIEKPFEGAVKEGFGGFWKGVGQGIVG